MVTIDEYFKRQRYQSIVKWSENIVNELTVINKELLEISNWFKANKLSVQVELIIW